MAMLMGSTSMGLVDGPTEVHKVQVAKAFLGAARQSAPGLFPSEHILTRKAAAQERYAQVLKAHATAAE